MSLYILVSVIILFVCLLLVLVVLVQNSKGGGLASNFSSSNQVMGVRKTADFLEKATWTLAIALCALAILSNAAIPKKSAEKTLKVEEQIESSEPPIDPNSYPELPTDLQD